MQNDDGQKHKKPATGWLAEAGRVFPLQVCKSYRGHYIGTLNDEGEPYTRESQEYWSSAEKAEEALLTNRWTQKLNL